jgi:aryl sulfotransferase
LAVGTRTRYRSVVYDSARWERLALREGDIVISTPPKCGTTWMQRLCALLIFDTEELERPLTEISPWLDMLTSDIESIVALLGAQTHRRFIKTHTPLDGLPWDERVTYLCVGRDPRDVALSWDNHLANFDLEAFLAAREAAVGLDDLAGVTMPEPPPRDPLERFWSWSLRDAIVTEDLFGLAGLFHHLGTFWARRDDPNIALFHYADLSADLPGQLARLAEVLGINRPAARIAELAGAATFERMRARATDFAPEVTHRIWRSNEQFFHRGLNGQWRELLDEKDLARYEARVTELAPPDLAAWVHHGWPANVGGQRPYVRRRRPSRRP